MRIHFGKHDGEDIEDIPSSYLAWLAQQTWFAEKWPRLAAAVADELDSRAIDQRRDDRPAKPGLTANIVKAWFRELVLRWHPDRAGGSHQAMTAIQDAHDRLKRMIQQ